MEQFYFFYVNRIKIIFFIKNYLTKYLSYQNKHLNLQL